MTVPATPAKPSFDVGSLIGQLSGLQGALKKGVLTSEFGLAAVGLLSSVLLGLFGKDWGLRAHAENIVTLALIVIPVGYGFVRALIKRSHNQVVAAALNLKAAELINGAHVVTNVVNPPAPQPGALPAAGVTPALQFPPSNNS